MAKKDKNITEVGKMSWSDLQKANMKDYTPTAEQLKWSQDYLQKSRAQYASQEYNPELNKEEHLRSSLYTEKTGWGESMFDNPTANENEYQHLQDVRAENQPWYSKIAAGIGKGVVTAGTTAAGAVGLVTGLIQGTANLLDGDKNTGFMDGLWNNPVNNLLQEINDLSEEYMPNYYTQYEQENPFIFNANFVGDKIIKNMGFMIGAFYGGIPYSSALGKAGTAIVKSSRAKNLANAEKMLTEANNIKKSAQAAGKAAGLSSEEIAANTASKLAERGLTDAQRAEAYLKGLDNIRKIAGQTRATTQLVGSITSAINEGSIEAINNSRDWADLEKQKAREELQEKKAAIIEQYGEGSEMVYPLFEQLDAEYSKKCDAIDRERAAVGNADFLMNIPILTMTNMFQYAKLYARGFHSTQRQMGSIFNGHKLEGDLAEGTLKTGKTWKGALGKALLNANSEGLEEYLQRAAGDAAGYTGTKSVENYITTGEDYDSAKWASSYIDDFAKAISDNASNPQALEEYAIGAISAMIGMPVFGSNTRNAWTGDNGKFGLAGGFVGEFKDYLDQKSHEHKIAEYMNERVKNPAFKEYYKGIIRHHKFDELLEEALKTGDKKAFKDAEFGQLFSDINAAASSGHLAEFKELIGYNKEYSDDELEDIIKNTSGVKTAKQQSAEDSATANGLIMQLAEIQKAIDLYSNVGRDDAGFESVQKRIETLKENKKEVQKELDAVNKRLEEDNYQDKKVGPFLRQDGTALNATEAGKQEMRDILEKNRTSLLSAIDDFLKIRDDIDIETDGKLDDENISLLSYLKAKILNIDQRAVDIKNNLLDGAFKQLSKVYKEDLSVLQETINKYQEEANKTDDKGKPTAAAKEAAKKLKEAEKTKSIVESKSKLLDEMKSMDVEEFQARMAHPAIPSSYLKDIIKSYNALDYSQRKSAATDLMDLTVLAQEKLAYNKKLNECLGDTSKINEAYQNARDKVEQETLNKQATELTSQLEKVKTVTDLHNFLQETKADPRAIESALSKLEESKDEGLKAILKEYKDLNKIYNDFRNILNRKNFPPEIATSIEQSLQSIWERVIESDDAEELKNDPKYIDKTSLLLKELKNLSKAYEAGGLKDLAEKVKEILQDYQQVEKSRGKKKNGKNRTASKESKKEDSESEVGDKKPKKTEEYSKEDIIKKIRQKLNSKVKGIKTDKDVEEFAKSLSTIHDEVKLLGKYNKLHENDGEAVTDAEILQIIQELLDDYINQEQESIEDTKDIDNDSSSAESNRSAEMSTEQRTSYTSYVVTQYALYDESNALMTTREEYEPANEVDKLTQDLLKKYLAYDFVEDGFLGAIAKDHTPDIFYLKSTDEKLAGVTFLAIEYDKDSEKIIKKNIFNGKSAKLDGRVKTITLDYNGEQKTFQIVGQLGRVADATDEVKTSYDRLQGLINDEFEEAKKDKKLAEQEFIVSTKYKNQVTTVNTGRLDLNDSGKQDLYSLVSESDDWKAGKEVYFGVVLNGQIDTKLEDRQDPNQQWMNDHNGAVVMFARKADGDLYPIRCTRRSVSDWLESKVDATKTGQDLLDKAIDAAVNEGLQGNEHINKIVLAVTNLFSNDFGAQVRAKTILSKYFILGKTSPIQIDAETNEVTVFDNIIGNDVSIEEKIQAFFDILADKEVLFTVPLGNWNLSGSGRSIVESGIMETGVNKYNNFNASFNIKPTNNEGHPEERKDLKDGRGSNNIRPGEYEIDGVVYEYTETDDEYTVTRKDGKEVTDDEDDLVWAMANINQLDSLLDDYISRHSIDSLDQSAPEFEKVKNILVIKNGAGEIIAYYDKNKPTRQRYVNQDTKEFKEIEEQFNKSYNDYVARKTLEIANRESDNKNEEKPSKFTSQNYTTANGITIPTTKGTKIRRGNKIYTVQESSVRAIDYKPTLYFKVDGDNNSYGYTHEEIATWNDVEIISNDTSSKPTYTATEKAEDHITMESSMSGLGSDVVFGKPNNSLDSRNYAGELRDKPGIKEVLIGNKTAIIWSTPGSIAARGGTAGLFFDRKLTPQEVQIVKDGIASDTSNRANVMIENIWKKLTSSASSQSSSEQEKKTPQKPTNWNIIEDFWDDATPTQLGSTIYNTDYISLDEAILYLNSLSDPKASAILKRIDDILKDKGRPGIDSYLSTTSSGQQSEASKGGTKGQRSHVLDGIEDLEELKEKTDEGTVGKIKKSKVMNNGTPKGKQFAYDVFRDIKQLEAMGEIDLNGKDLDDILNILNHVNAKERQDKWTNYAKEHGCK